MLEYLDKFTKLPADIQQKASSHEVLLALDDLLERYGVDLASFVIRVMVGEVNFKNILAHLINEFDLELEKAELLEAELRDRVFKRVQDYLLGTAKAEPATKQEALEVETVVARAEASEQKTKRLPPAKEEKPMAVSGPSPAAAKEHKPVLGKTFIEEDAKEIEAFKQNIPAAPASEADRLSILAASILSEADLSLPSEGLNLRFKQIITTYLRGIRTRIEVRETMLKPVINGGMNFDAPQADRVLAIARKLLEEENKKVPLGKIKVEEGPVGFVLKKEEIDEALGKIPPRPPENIEAAAEYDLAAELKKGNVAAPPEAPVSVKPADKGQRKAAVTSGKKRMEDIKTPQVMSPIDELAYMDLVTFRRLDSDPARRCRKIEDKIGLLGKDGIDKQLEGIKAWRLNPVNKTYLAMGQESISSNRNIDDIINDFKAKGLNYLTRGEFEAIMDLNNRLRF